MFRMCSLMGAALTSVLLLVLAACAQTTATPQATTPAGNASAAAATPGPAPAGEAGTAAAPVAPKPRIATAPDGTKIAFEVAGSGPAILLVHGGGQTRRSWNQLGYVDRLAKTYTVVTLDLRGVGDSGKPNTADAYALDKVLADLTAVADAAGVKRFHVYGFGHGGTLARYLAARSDRVQSAVLVAMTLGPAATGVFKTAIEAMRAKWQPALAAHAAGTLDLKAMPASDRTAWDAGIATNVLMLSALLDYPPVEPADIKIPTLWAVGSDDSAMENVKEYEPKLTGTRVTLKVLGSVNYSDSFIKMEQVLTEIEPFLAKAAATTETPSNAR